MAIQVTFTVDDSFEASVLIAMHKIMQARVSDDNPTRDDVAESLGIIDAWPFVCDVVMFGAGYFDLVTDPESDEYKNTSVGFIHRAHLARLDAVDKNIAEALNAEA